MITTHVVTTSKEEKIGSVMHHIILVWSLGAAIIMLVDNGTGWSQLVLF